MKFVGAYKESTVLRRKWCWHKHKRRTIRSSFTAGSTGTTRYLQQAPLLTRQRSCGARPSTARPPRRTCGIPERCEKPPSCLNSACVFTALVAKKLPLPCISTVLVSEAPPSEFRRVSSTMLSKSATPPESLHPASESTLDESPSRVKMLSPKAFWIFWPKSPFGSKRAFGYFLSKWPFVHRDHGPRDESIEQHHVERHVEQESR